MSSQSQSFRNLPTAVTDRLEQIIHRFEQAWHKGDRPNLADYLKVGPNEHLPLLIELVHTDLECRFKAGEPIRSKDYLDRFPELASRPDLASGLIRREFELRRRREPGLRYDEFKACYPTYLAGPEQSVNRTVSTRSASPPLLANKLEAEFRGLLGPPQEPDELGRFGTYRVLGVLGSGGMGVVFRAEDPVLKRPVALKVMLPGMAALQSARARFLREGRVVARLKHDHIVTVYGGGEVPVSAGGSLPYLAMELLRGESLHDRLLREGKLPVGEVVRIGAEMARGLAAAHRAGLVHRDIKPANVWLDADTGRAKLLDFGLAGGGDDAQLTQSGMVLGTPAYMSPEQARAEPADSRSDLFSTGAVLYHLCTGKLPFSGKTAQAMLDAVLHQAPKSVASLNPKVPIGLVRLIHKLLDKKPNRRPPSADEVARSLVEMNKRAADKAEKKSRHPGTKHRSVTRLLMAGAALGVLIGTFLWYSAFRALTRVRPRVAMAGSAALEKGGQPANTEPQPAKGKEQPVIDSADTDRLVAEWALKIGGRVGIWNEKPNTPMSYLTNISALPKSRFRIRALDLAKASGVTEADLARLRELTKLEHLELQGTGISDAGLAKLKGMTGLTYLGLQWTRVTPNGLGEVLPGLTGLQRLNLADLTLSDDCLKHMSRLSNLRHLHLPGTSLTGTGLKHLSGLRQLRELNLHGCVWFKDSDLRWLKGLKYLERLELNVTLVTDRGLEHLRELPELRYLLLQNTLVTDEGLKHLQGLRKLQGVYFRDTKVTASGARWLRTRLPGCQVDASMDRDPKALGRVATGKWLNAMPSPTAMKGRKGITFQGQSVQLDSASVEVPAFGGRDMVLRATVRRAGGAVLYLRCGKKEFYSAWYNADGGLGVGKGMGGQFHDLKIGHLPAPKEEFVNIAFAAVGDTLTVFYNDHFVEVKDTSLTEGGAAFGKGNKGANDFYKDLQIQVLKP